jgi:hypothetical protein
VSRGLALAFLLGLTFQTQGAAQQTGPLIRYGKWVMAAGAVTMNLLAAGAHNEADDAFSEIETACSADPNRCVINSDGEYADPEMEAAYQTSLHYDRMAQRWLVLGETALVGATVMFVWEFTHKKHEPDNIPFEPEVRVLRNATGLGIRIPW